MAGLSSAAAKIEDAAVKVPAEAVRGSRHITGDKDRALQAKLSIVAKSRGATQRHLVEVLTVDKPVVDLSDEELMDSSSSTGSWRMSWQCRSPTRAARSLSHGGAVRLEEAGLQMYFESLLEQVSGPVLSKVNVTANQVEKAFVVASAFVRDLPEVDEEVDAYMSMLATGKDQLNEWLVNFRHLGCLLDSLKEAMPQCVAKADAVSSEALLST